MLSFQDVQITEASAANFTFEDLLVCDVIGVDIHSQHSILPVRVGRGTGYS
jgi:hypothetical protein